MKALVFIILTASLQANAFEFKCSINGIKAKIEDGTTFVLYNDNRDHSEISDDNDLVKFFFDGNGVFNSIEAEEGIEASLVVSNPLTYKINFLVEPPYYHPFNVNCIVNPTVKSISNSTTVNPRSGRRQGNVDWGTGYSPSTPPRQVDPWSEGRNANNHSDTRACGRLYSGRWGGYGSECKPDSQQSDRTWGGW